MLKFLSRLDADDIFISYSRKDGSAYVKGLDAALSKRGFSCFTDKRGTDAGPIPPQTLFRKIRGCKTLVLLATPCALANPKHIASEVTEFANANGTSRIVSVSFEGDQEFVFTTAADGIQPLADNRRAGIADAGVLVRPQQRGPAGRPFREQAGLRRDVVAVRAAVLGPVGRGKCGAE